MSDAKQQDIIKNLKNKILDISSFHSEFHYQGSYEYFNLGCGLLKSGKFSDSIDCFNKSISIYRENADSYYARGFAKFLMQSSDFQDDFRESFRLRNIYQSSYIEGLMEYIPYNLIEDTEAFAFNHRVNNKTKNESINNQAINSLYSTAEKCFEIKHFIGFVEQYKKIISMTSNAHFDYHVDIANLNFALAIEYEKLDMYYEAIFFASRALETDELNPHNKAYENLIAKCRIKSDSCLAK